LSCDLQIAVDLFLKIPRLVLLVQPLGRLLEEVGEGRQQCRADDLLGVAQHLVEVLLTTGRGLGVLLGLTRELRLELRDDRPLSGEGIRRLRLLALLEGDANPGGAKLVLFGRDLLDIDAQTTKRSCLPE